MALQLLTECIAHRLPHPGQRLQARGRHKEYQHGAVEDGLFVQGPIVVADRAFISVDGNEAAASIAHLTSEVVAIYPITPASPMGDLADHWTSRGRASIFSSVPEAIETESEAGAAGVVHGALQAGALTTTFAAPQGLLLTT